MVFSETRIPSTLDGELQPLRIAQADGEERPLMVALHSWYGDVNEPVFDEYALRCREHDWHLVFPGFRGPNTNPEACGSERVIADVLDAVNWAKTSLSMDHNRVYLVGAGGGGHLALLLASQAPAVWTSVSAWLAVSDLAQWHDETSSRNLSYARDLRAVCGGPPGSSAAVDREYASRSPLHMLWRAHIVPLEICTGIHDGHDGLPVPVSQSIRAFNTLAHFVEDYEHMVGEDAIAYIEEHERVPEWCDPGDVFDPVFPTDIVLRRMSKLTRLTLFEGGHDTLYDAVFTWFEAF